ncbi:2-hydroxychromene-2-carboxylate isomerase [Amylibacter sp. IMCC11727]|uniref:2-hydroxychromene-2-carboxylate isomerase n=1 Tax=Amylibacter sp. IMCC11727 TaxID=3039851 RepID=UPI00244E5B91|nr:2-hydroxychromene-2-carboxylate isomerase [Amylibacter sp. IMCC11727]WGI22881.1 2-hydroxychromene-2-carboxylate isomerase [Amylibacter sp. IMCC11727]
MKKLTFWFEFASTYSYLSALRIEDVAGAAGVAVEWKPFLLGPIFAAQGLTDSPFNVYPVKGEYMWRDMARECVKYGLPVAKQPDVFPGNGLLAARVATLGAGQDWQADFVRGVYLAQFVEGKALADARTSVDVLETLGIDGAAAVERAMTDQTVKDALKANTAAAQDAGIFGAPSFTTSDGEVFWGNDRMDDAIAWAGQR